MLSEPSDVISFVQDTSTRIGHKE